MSESSTHPALKRVAPIHDAISALIDNEWPDDPGDVADLTGEVRFEETRLADFRRLLLAETMPGEGERYKVQTTYPKTRTFNTQRILSDLMTAQDDPNLLALLFELIGNGTIKLTFTWTKLKEAFERHDVNLIVASHEVADDLDEPAHVGEVKGEYSRVVAK